MKFLPAIFVIATILASCGDKEPEKQDGKPAIEIEIQSIGEGETTFLFEVDDGNSEIVKKFEVRTDETTVGAALLKAELIAGENSEYGLYVKEVCGITADYDTDQSYWAFYIDGEYAVSGVDSTNIEAGKTYAFVYTKD